jgi:hypothetical protein
MIPTSKRRYIRAIAWEHTLHMELGQKSRRLTYSAANPWGAPAWTIQLNTVSRAVNLSMQELCHEHF